MVWLDALMNFVPVPIIVFERGTARFVLANAAAMRYLRPEAVGTGSADNASGLTDAEVAAWRRGLMDPSGRPLSEDEWPGRRISFGGPFENAEMMWVNPSGRRYHFLVSACILPATADRPEAGAVSFVDVTNHILQNERLREMVVLRDDFISVAGHELKTPITSAKLRAQKAAKSACPEDRNQIEAVIRSVDRLERIVEDLMEVTRMSNPHKLHPKDVDFREVVQDCVVIHTEMYEKQHVRLTVEIPDHAVRGRWDWDRVHQAVCNLFENALKYGLGRPVEAQVVARMGYVELRVRDYGPGILPQDRERIFHKFERASLAGQYSGLGLGLWISREAARSMGGDIWVETPPGAHGSVFVLQIPYGIDVPSIDGT